MTTGHSTVSHSVNLQWMEGAQYCISFCKLTLDGRGTVLYLILGWKGHSTVSHSVSLQWMEGTQYCISFLKQKKTLGRSTPDAEQNDDAFGSSTFQYRKSTTYGKRNSLRDVRFGDGWQ
ncbi:hypothetical protein BgiBS90_007061 [Biomphalaria glabrata]|nr:hypothetical protein BgiBS90_007061 [Biomphalaria glabrata]